MSRREVQAKYMLIQSSGIKVELPSRKVCIANVYRALESRQSEFAQRYFL